VGGALIAGRYTPPIDELAGPQHPVLMRNVDFSRSGCRREARVCRYLISVDGFLRGKRYLIHDRDPLFTDAFRAVLRAAGIECLKLLPEALT
jgi:hypothetical protein